MTPTLGLLLGAVLFVALFLYTFWPERAAAAQPEKTRLDYLLERKEQLYENLRDLNFEHRAGKYPQEDFEAQRSSLERETATLLNEIASLQKT
jgi:predicted nuclease with TOPRIM domain